MKSLSQFLSKIVDALGSDDQKPIDENRLNANAQSRNSRSRAEAQNVKQLEASSGTDAPGLERFNVDTQQSPIPEWTPCHTQIHGYTLGREIGRGGQAVIFEARQISTGQKVAIKVLLNGEFASRYDVARFNREVHLLAVLNHPSIVRIIDQGVTSEGIHYLVMAFVEGVSLTSILKKSQSGPQNLAANQDLDHLLSIFLKICEAVNYAHLRGVVHRDLKPANIIIDDNNDPHILDFGLARTVIHIPESADEKSLSIPGQFIGSLPWSSPEQAQGQHDKVDTRSDVYSLGVILYQILTGQFPYDVTGPMHEVVRNIVRNPPNTPLRRRSRSEPGLTLLNGTRAPHFIARVLDQIARKALSKERNDRYQTAGELARDVSECLAGRPTIAAGDSGIVRRRFNLVAVAVIMTWLVLLSLVVTRHVLFAYYPSAVVPKASVLPPTSSPDPIKPDSPAGPFGPSVEASQSPTIIVRDFDRPRVVIGIAAAYTKAEWLAQMARDFIKTPRGQGVEVRLIPMNYITTHRAVLDADRRINMAAPINGYHAASFGDEWKRLNGQDLLLRVEQTGKSPMVFLANRKLVASLPHGEQDLTFRWIHDHIDPSDPARAQKNRGIRFGFGNPLTTGSGISQLAVMAYELKSKTGDLVPADAPDPGFLQRFAYDNTSFYSSVESLMRSMDANGSSRFDAVFVSEAAAIRKLILSPETGTRMQMVYPRYNVSNEEPIYILNVPWSNAQQRSACNDFVDFLISGPAQEKMVHFGMRPTDPQVRLDSSDSPFVRFSNVGVRIKLDPYCEPPADHVIEALEAAWRKATPDID